MFKVQSCDPEPSGHGLLTSTTRTSCRSAEFFFPFATSTDDKVLLLPKPARLRSLRHDPPPTWLSPPSLRGPGGSIVPACSLVHRTCLRGDMKPTGAANCCRCCRQSDLRPVKRELLPRAVGQKRKLITATTGTLYDKAV